MTTLKVTLDPTLLVALEGCVEIIGTSGVTVKLVLDVAVPPAVVTEIAYEAPEAALTVNVIVVELTTVKLEAEVVPCLTAVVLEKLVPVIVTVLPKTAELGVFTFELANELIVDNEFVVTEEEREDAAESK